MATRYEEWTARAEDGATLRLGVPDAAVPTVWDYWPPTGLERSQEGLTREPGKYIELVLAANGAHPEVLIDGQAVGGGWLRFESELSLFAADHLQGRVAIHAGLAIVDGHGLLLPGSTHAGKSTLCLAFAEAGAIVLSDEYALVDPPLGTPPDGIAPCGDVCPTVRCSGCRSPCRTVARWSSTVSPAFVTYSVPIAPRGRP